MRRGSWDKRTLQLSPLLHVSLSHHLPRQQCRLVSAKAEADIFFFYSSVENIFFSLVRLDLSDTLRLLRGARDCDLWYYQPSFFFIIIFKLWRLQLFISTVSLSLFLSLILNSRFPRMFLLYGIVLPLFSGFLHIQCTRCFFYARFSIYQHEISGFFFFLIYYICDIWLK